MSAEIEEGTALINFQRGGPCINPDHAPLHLCAVCEHHTEATFHAESDTHRIANRSGDPIDVGLCVRCWGRLLKEDS